MAITVVKATSDTALHLEVCPSYSTVCACPTQPAKLADGSANPLAGKLVTPHPTFAFALSSGDPKDTRTPDQWAQACAQEAVLIVKGAPGASKTVAAAVGVSA